MAVFWIVVGVLLAIAEAFTATFVLIMFAAGAFAAAIAAALGATAPVQAAVFAVVSVLSLVAIRPVIKRHRLSGDTPDAEPGLDSLEGAPGVVLEQVTQDEGLVKIHGELWSARVYDATQVIAPGERVRVMGVRGATALVWRDEFAAPSGGLPATPE